MDKQLKSEDGQFTRFIDATSDTVANTDTNLIDDEPTDFIGRKTNTDNKEFVNPAIGEQTGEIKRGRGRPKGSRNRDKSGETIGLQTETLDVGKKERRGRKPRFMLQQDAETTSAFILNTIQTVAIETLGLGAEAQFNQVESLLLALSLPKYLASIELSTIENGTKFLYPLAALLGSTMYGLRIAGMVIEKRKETKEIEVEQETNNQTDTKVNDRNGNTGDINWSVGKIDMSKYNRPI